MIIGMSFGCSGSEADRLGVGAECTDADDCEDEPLQECLEFKGGYCGIADCEHDIDCPEDAACIAHEDGINYCFRVCVDKPDCNENRSLENESNCSSSVTFVDGTMGRKACVPPSG
jgi:hypothetical protein